MVSSSKYQDNCPKVGWCFKYLSKNKKPELKIDIICDSQGIPNFQTHVSWKDEIPVKIRESRGIEVWAQTHTYHQTPSVSFVSYPAVKFVIYPHTDGPLH